NASYGHFWFGKHIFLWTLKSRQANFSKYKYLYPKTVCIQARSFRTKSLIFIRKKIGKTNSYVAILLFANFTMPEAIPKNDIAKIVQLCNQLEIGFVITEADIQVGKFE